MLTASLVCFSLGLYAISALDSALAVVGAWTRRGASASTGPSVPRRDASAGAVISPTPPSLRKRPALTRHGGVLPATPHATDTRTWIRRFIESVRYRDILLFIQTKYILKITACLETLVVNFGGESCRRRVKTRTVSRRS